VSAEHQKVGTWAAKLRLDPAAQQAIRVALAVGAASAVGSLLSEQRFYWAVVAVFVAFMGANTVHEQVTKAAHRVIGTAIGILVGGMLAHLIQNSLWSIAFILLSVGLGTYLAQYGYAIMVIGMTIGVGQLYEQLGTYTDNLFVLRLEETAIGAAIAIVAALAIFPVRTGAAMRIAAHDFIAEIGNLLDQAAAKVGRASDVRLTGVARSVDAANQQLLATARPVMATPFGSERIAQNLGLFRQAAHHARNLALDVERGGVLDPRLSRDLAEALSGVRETVNGIQERSASAKRRSFDKERLFDDLERSPVNNAEPVRLAFRELARLDEILVDLRDQTATAG
jgi:uncharacterized membrane protein YccC